MGADELRDFLEQKYLQYNCSAFVDEDPISVPHQFKSKEDIEISAFFAATLAWGGRKAIIKSANDLVQRMDLEPYNFVMAASETDLRRLAKFVYRTFNGEDAIFFVRALRSIYLNHSGLLGAFSACWGNGVPASLIHFRKLFFGDAEMPIHASKHVADVAKGASAKRLNMFLRWMVRKDQFGVDFGLWNHLGAEKLYLPLDVHTGNVGRKLGLLTRTQTDWRAVNEITESLREFDPVDPIKYDFALFGLGVYEKF